MGTQREFTVTVTYKIISREQARVRTTDEVHAAAERAAHHAHETLADWGIIPALTRTLTTVEDVYVEDN